MVYAALSRTCCFGKATEGFSVDDIGDGARGATGSGNIQNFQSFWCGHS